MVRRSERKKFDFKTDSFIRFLIGLVTVGLIAGMFPRYESVETDYSVGMIWSKEDLIAPFNFPIYKSPQTYQSEVNVAKEKVYPIFDINQQKLSGKINWLDSLSNLFIKLDKIYAYESELTKEKNLPEEKRTTSDQTLSVMKSEQQLALIDAEWKALYSSISTASGGDAFKKKIVQSINQVSDKKIIDISK